MFEKIISLFSLIKRIINASISNILLGLIRFYQRFISRLKPYPTCKYIPTCSCYACEAIKKNGAILGTMLAIWRILRCNPISNGGYDPVPDLRNIRRKK